jgi:transposase-like protein
MAELPVSTTKKKRSFEAAFKLKVVEHAEKKSNRDAARVFSVDESQVRNWRKHKHQLINLPSKKRRLEGAGRKPLLQDVEEQLENWIENLRADNLRVTRSSIQEKAKELVAVSENSSVDFVASRGWLENFLKRKQFTLRRRTTVGQHLPNQMIPKVAQFVMNIRKLAIQHCYSLRAIGNMDETPVWLDMPGDTTITRVGSQSVPVRTTGHEKARFTVVLAAMADGTKLKPFVIFKGVRAIPELNQIQGVVVALSRNGWMNEQLTKDWVNRVWGRLAFSRRLLVWDAYKCHMMDSVKSMAKRGCNSDIVFIPGGLTKHLQPADVSWNKPFKAAYKRLYDDWMANGEKSYTAAGNVRAPSKVLALEWVKKSWDLVTEDVVKNSFKVCGISVKVDGSEDGQISCIKAGAVANDAATIIEQQTAQLNDQDSDYDNDPLYDNDPFFEEDGEELEENELIIDDDCML